MVHGTGKMPKGCSLHPMLPPIKHEGCGYYFIDTQENKIVKGVV